MDITNTRELLQRYPFLRIRDWEGKVDDRSDYSWWDAIPGGWRLTFGEQMMEELRVQLIKEGCLDTYYPIQVKEKWGALRWYDNGASREVQAIIDKYEVLSAKICIFCGKPATRMTMGWIVPVCNDCGDPSWRTEPLEEVKETICIK